MTGALCGTCVNVRLAYRPCLCGSPRRMVVWSGGDWYGEYRTCLTCGEQYGGGEVLARPSRPRWREQHIARAKRLLEGVGGG